MRKVLKLFVLFVLLMIPVLAACGDSTDSIGEDPGSSSEDDSNSTTDSSNDDSSSSDDSGDKPKVGILAPAVTHGWVAAVAYHAETHAEELSDQIDYQIHTSSDASEMTA